MAGVGYRVLTDDERKNLAHIACIVLDLIPKAMRKILTYATTEKDVRDAYLRSQVRIKKEYALSYDEKKMCEDPGHQFVNCDTTCLYKIIRNFSTVQCPTRGWGQKVESCINYGDIVEKLRETRNAIVHSPHVRFSRTKMELMKENIRKMIDTICLNQNNEDLKINFQSYVF